ncbi:MAG: glycoside hydrolase family 3 C-terminal domain-containing protein [Ruminococcus flavefaciens]|nr:glycoside hydrolase family 3 C-terminal domain-containing protein [Ruminococcus flavefaciens]
MEKYRIYGNRTADETELEKQNRLLSREVAKEGFVLLKNNGVLPLKDKKISLFGGGARLTVKGGSGSGDVHERYCVSIEQGLINNGVEIANAAWLDRFTQKYEQDKKEFVDKVEAAIKGYTLFNVMAMFAKISEFKLAYPVGDEITPEDLSDDTDTCVYVIARQAGEGDDRKLEKGDFYLSDLEVNNIRICSEHYKNVIVVINCGSTLDISPLEEMNIGAIIYYGQAGEEGGNALAEVLTGKTTPCGKLTDTWGRTYSDYPLSLANNYPAPDKLDENYYEGIYVGYRWFEAKNIKPLYPFGYGLSYTEFTHGVTEVKVNGGIITVTTSVKNVGKEYSGKEIIQAYLAKPNDKYDGERIGLVAYAKTQLLAPNEEAKLTLTFDIADSAVYDESKSAFLLESGEYGVYIGTDALNNKPYAVLKVETDIITEQCKGVCRKEKEFADFKRSSERTEYDKTLPIYTVESIVTKTHTYENKIVDVTPKVEKYLKKLSNKQLAMFCMGGGYFTKTFNKVPGACGNTTSRLVKKGIPNIIMSDGPAGINILQKQAFTKRTGFPKYVDELPKDWQWGFLKKLVPKLKFLFAKKKHIHVYQYCTAWPNATTVAQTWNVELTEKMGAAIGREMLVMGVTLWLAPALNIHRDPLCGRNFEYYSEDPYFSGTMAAAITRGVQSNKGVGVTIKHFACNNRENQRMEVSSNLSERALREIYLKGFKIAVRDNPLALMSSYNRINGIYAANNYGLLTDILNCEWGYKGLVMSDWDGAERSPYAEVIKSGNHMIMPGRKDIYKKLLKAIKKKELTRQDMLYGAARALNIIFDAPTSKGF